MLEKFDSLLSPEDKIILKSNFLYNEDEKKWFYNNLEKYSGPVHDYEFAILNFLYNNQKRSGGQSEYESYVFSLLPRLIKELFELRSKNDK